MSYFNLIIVVLLFVLDGNLKATETISLNDQDQSAASSTLSTPHDTVLFNIVNETDKPMPLMLWLSMRTKKKCFRSEMGYSSSSMSLNPIRKTVLPQSPCTFTESECILWKWFVDSYKANPLRKCDLFYEGYFQPIYGALGFNYPINDSDDRFGSSIGFEIDLNSYAVGDAYRIVPSGSDGFNVKHTKVPVNRLNLSEENEIVPVTEDSVLFNVINDTDTPLPIALKLQILDKKERFWKEDSLPRGPYGKCKLRAIKKLILPRSSCVFMESECALWKWFVDSYKAKQLEDCDFKAFLEYESTLFDLRFYIPGMTVKICDPYQYDFS